MSFCFYGSYRHKYSLTQIPAASWWAIAYLVGVGSVLTFIAFIYALQHLTTELRSVTAYLNPIVADLFGAFLSDEHLTAAIILGAMVH